MICIPGLSQDARSFEYLGSRLGSPLRQVVAISPRGRGESVTTPAGTYGWLAHARDAAEAATLLERPTFDAVGWSMGAFVTLQLAAAAPGRIRRAVLLDAIGRPEPESVPPILNGLQRLGASYGSVEEYTARVLSAGTMAACREAWEGYLAADLMETPEGLKTRTSSEAVMEDARYGADQDPYGFWSSLTMPVLLVRAGRPILPGLGFVVSEADRDRFRSEVRLSQVVEVDTNHHCLGMAADTAQAVARFLDE